MSNLSPPKPFMTAPKLLTTEAEDKKPQPDSASAFNLVASDHSAAKADRRARFVRIRPASGTFKD